jgi:hypothetical protein
VNVTNFEGVFMYCTGVANGSVPEIWNEAYYNQDLTPVKSHQAASHGGAFYDIKSSVENYINIPSGWK